MNAAALTAYNERNQLIGELQYIEVQWNRKWKDWGTWTAQMRAEDYPSPSNNPRFVKLSGRPEVGVIQKKEFEHSSRGNFIIISGFFLPKLLNWASSVLTYRITNWSKLKDYANRTLDSVSRVPETSSALEDVNVDTFYKVKIYDPISIPSVSGVIEPKTCVGDALLDLLPSDRSLSAEVLLPSSPVNGEIGMAVSVKKANDKTSLVFSLANGNIETIKYSRDESNMQSVARTILKIPPGTNISTAYWDEYYAVNGTAKGYTGDDGNNIAVVHYDQGVNPWVAPGIEPTYIVEGQTSYELKSGNESKIKAELAEKGRLDALNHRRERAATASVLQIPGYQYLTDYDLGDNITLSIPEMESSSFTVRIMAVNEVHSANKCKVELELGTLYSRARF